MAMNLEGVVPIHEVASWYHLPLSEARAIAVDAELNLVKLKVGSRRVELVNEQQLNQAIAKHLIRLQPENTEGYTPLAERIEQQRQEIDSLKRRIVALEQLVTTTWHST